MLAAILRRQPALLSTLEIEDFQSDEYRALYSMMELFLERYNTVPTRNEFMVLAQTVIDNFGGDSEFGKKVKKAADITASVYDSDTDDRVLKDVSKGFLKNSRLDRVLYQIASDKAETTLSSALASLQEAAQFELKEADMSVFSDMSRLENAHEILQKIPFGIESFDDMTQGGLLRPSLMLVVGKPYAGKTQILLNMADNFIRNGYTVLYFTMELNNELLMMRMDAARLGKKYTEIYAKNRLDKTRKELQNSIDRDAHGELVIVKYPPGTSVTKIKMHCDLYKSSFGGFDIVMVDYIGLLTPRVKTDSMFKEGKSIGEDLVALAEEHDVSVIAAAQTTRGAVSVDVKDLTEEHIGSSFALQHVAYDVVLLSKSQNNIFSNKLQVKYVKNRSGGQLGIISMYEIPNTFKLTDDLNEMFELAQKSGQEVLPDAAQALLDAVNSEEG